jgi:gas vesicle protein
MNTSNNSGKIVGTLVVGALVGAALGLLFATRKGKKIREKIEDGAADVANNLKEKASAETSDIKKIIKAEGNLLKNSASDLEDFVERNIENATSILTDKAKTLLQMNSVDSRK